MWVGRGYFVHRGSRDGFHKGCIMKGCFYRCMIPYKVFFSTRVVQGAGFLLHGSGLPTQSIHGLNRNVIAIIAKEILYLQYVKFRSARARVGILYTNKESETIRDCRISMELNLRQAILTLLSAL